jgi:hypothetical protein
LQTNNKPSFAPLLFSVMLEIQLSPRQGYTDEDDDDWEATGTQYGMDYNSMEVEPGEDFTIDKNLNASVNCDDTRYVLRKTDRFGPQTVRGEGDLFLKPGRYHFHEDGFTIERL